MSTWTYDLATDVGAVRLTIGDTNIDPTSNAVFSDEELQYWIDAEGSVELAAAAALEALAASRARVAKMLKSLNYGEDTRGVAAELLKTAATLRERVSQVPAYGAAEKAYSDFSIADIVANEALREG